MVFMVRQHMYARTTGACTKQKKRVSDNGRTKIVVRVSWVFKSTNTVAFRIQKRYPSIVCLLFCEKNLFYFYNHNRNSRLLAILRNVLCKLSVSLVNYCFCFLKLFCFMFVSFCTSQKKKSRRPLKKKGHTFLSQKSVKVKKNLYVYMKKKSPPVGQTMAKTTKNHRVHPWRKKTTQ